MYVCMLDATGQVLVHRNVTSTPEAFLATIAPYRNDLVVAAECMFTWYWLADLCAAEGIAFVLGHALAMKAIHGGKAKNDKIDSHKIASLLRGGLLESTFKVVSGSYLLLSFELSLVFVNPGTCRLSVVQCDLAHDPLKFVRRRILRSATLVFVQPRQHLALIVESVNLPMYPPILVC
jgi:hypothetical protein